MEETWKKARWTDPFIGIEGELSPKYGTQAKILWDSTNLYFFAKMEEPHVWADIKNRDEVIFYNNDFEIFIDPDGDTHNYMELEINALNTVWDLFLTKPYRNQPKVIDNWDIIGLKTAVYVDGTLNDPEDIDRGWSVEIAMPWPALTETSAQEAKLPVNEFWRINFSRVNWQHEIADSKYHRKKDENGKHLPEYNWAWSPQYVINMHEPERWGYVYFTNQPGTKFHIPEDEKVKWKLYGLYREIRNKPISEEAHKILINQQEINAHIEKHQSGWNLWVKSPFTGRKIIIKEDGQMLVTDAK